MTARSRGGTRFRASRTPLSSGGCCTDSRAEPPARRSLRNSSFGDVERDPIEPGDRVPKLGGTNGRAGERLSDGFFGHLRPPARIREDGAVHRRRVRLEQRSEVDRRRTAAALQGSARCHHGSAASPLSTEASLTIDVARRQEAYRHRRQPQLTSCSRGGGRHSTGRHQITRNDAWETGSVLRANNLGIRCPEGRRGSNLPSRTLPITGHPCRRAPIGSPGGRHQQRFVHVGVLVGGW
jgi:hypothetical protein